jgi:putative Mg2+ transporter-C (MgtC) family protein
VTPGIETFEFVLRLSVAALLAGIIGIDREIRNKTMGLRTLMLVSSGAALFTMLGIELTGAAREYVEIDPARVLQGVVAGIGLIAMGGVMHKDDRVRGATTGASVWVVGSIGAACGLGLYTQAAVATAVAAFIVILLGTIERAIQRWLRSRRDDEP